MKKTLAIILALAMLLSLCACGSGSNSSSSNTQSAAEPTTEPTGEPSSSGGIQPTEEPQQPDEDDETPAASGSDIIIEYPASQTDLSAEPINIMVLNGTTGFGMAKLINDVSSGNAVLNYNISVETDASNITAALINGTVDIAALPTNAASVVYNKTEGAVQVLALNTAGVLYLVANSESESISSLSDLEGKTVYAPAQNPSFIFSAICQKAGVNVTVDTSYAQPADLRTAVAAGEVALAVLPEPMVTMACAANDKLAVSLDLTAEWAAAFGSDSLIQGCVVVRREFAETHAAELAVFLQEYEASIDYLSAEPASAAEMIVAAEIFANAGVAQKAIPNCNIIFVAGADMAAQLDPFLETMFEVAPASIGGAVPADDFYYVG